jgi:hypothetical protein
MPAEYAEFIVVPELAYNYNGRFGADSGVMQELSSVLSDPDFSESFWSESPIQGMCRMVDEGHRVLHVNETGTHYILMYHNGSDSTEWLEVMETPTYKRTMWLQEFAQGEFMEDSIDSVEITEFDDDVFTRSIRFFDRFSEDGSPNATFNVQIFGGIHRADDPQEQILGVMMQSQAATTSTPWTVAENEGQRAVAAFDLSNLMIRPSVEEFATTPFRFPYDQFSTYELAGPTDNDQWRAYDAPQEDGGDPVGPQNGDSFTASEFVTIESVLAFLGTGLLPEDVITVNLLGIPSDQITDSGILDFPDWQREDVPVEMGS